jgi:hypothetical protein
MSHWDVKVEFIQDLLQRLNLLAAESVSLEARASPASSTARPGLSFDVLFCSLHLLFFFSHVIHLLLTYSPTLGVFLTFIQRTLGPFDLVMFGIGCVIGAGVYVLTGQVAATTTGPSLVLSMVCVSRVHLMHT